MVRRDRLTSKLEGRDQLIMELEGIIEDLTEQMKRDQNLLTMQQQQKTHPTLQDGTLNSELDSSVNQSNCLSPIKAGKLSNMLLKESIEGSVFSNAIKVKACMPNF